MREVHILVLDEDVESVTLALAQLGVIELSDSEMPSGWQQEVEEEWGRLASEYSALVRRLGDLFRLLELHPRPRPVHHLSPRKDLEHMCTLCTTIEEAIRSWAKARAETEQRIQHRQALLKHLQILAPLDIPVEALQEQEHVYIALGVLQHENLPRLERSLFRIPFTILPIAQVDDHVAVVVVTPREHKETLDRALHSAFWTPISLPEDVRGSPQEAIAQVQAHLEDLHRQLQEHEAHRRRLIEQWEESLVEMWHRAQANALLARAMSRYGRRDSLRLISGWVPASQVDVLSQTILEITQGRVTIEVREPTPHRLREVPTFLHMPRWLRPFAQIVTTFGVPSYTEINPTPLVALTFLFMYGMMFGDVGHGLLLLLAAWFAHRRGWLGKEMAQLVGAAGVSGALFGFIYGSVLGYEHLLPALWTRPLEGMGQILLLGVIAGVFVLNVGFLLNAFNAWRERDWERLLVDKNGLVGWLLYWVLLGGAVSAARGRALPWTGWGSVILLLAGLLFLHEPLGRWLRGEGFKLSTGWGTYSVQAFFELFEALISYISNSLSFIRLGAFAVAHAGLSQVIFLLAHMAGSVGYWLVVLIGTIVIVGFEGLIVGIQTLRLEYYEFFSKFFRGEGRPFHPLRLPS